MIVVCIIGMLSAVAIPSMRNARIQAQAMGIANDLRVFGAAFSQYSLEYGTYPTNFIVGDLPDKVASYLKTPQDWPNGPACGGEYFYMPAAALLGMAPPGLFSNPHVVGMQNTDPTGVHLSQIDLHIDDGVMGGSGSVWWVPGLLWYFIEK